MKLTLQGMTGERPKVTPHLLAENMAQTAKNCNLERGTIAPFKVPLPNWTPTKVGTIASIYLYEDSYWFHWTTDVACRKGPISDVTARTYFTGDGVPKVTDNAIALTGGGTDYPINSYTLGIPKPGSAPTVTAGGASVDPNEAVSTVYVYTYVSAWGEEGPPSDASSAVDIEPTQTGELSGMSTAPTGAYNIATKRIYRSVTALDETTLMFVAEIPVATTAYSDAVDASALGEELLTDGWIAPPTDMHSLVSMPNGMMAGLSGKTLCFCVANQPHAWPVAYQLALDAEGVGLGVYGNSVLVLTEAQPYIAMGTSPDAVVLERLEIDQACVSRRGIADMGYAVAYPSPDGLQVIGAGVAKNLTANILTRTQWQALKPESILGVCHDGKYFGFYNTGTVTGGFILDPAREDMVFIDTFATAAYSDPKTDTLYLVVNGEIVQWDAGASNMTATYTGKLYDLPYPANFCVAEVLATAYPVTFKLYGDGTLRFTKTVTSKEPFWLPSGFLCDSLYISMEMTTEVKRVSLAESIEELS